MAYLEQGRKASPASMAAVIGVHAGMAVALVWGLNVSGIVIDDEIITTWDIPGATPVPPEPTPPDQARPDTKQPVEQVIVAPKPLIDIPVNPGTIDTTQVIPKVIPTIDQGTFDPVVPSPAPTFDPVRAAPRNNPGAWVTTNDYRTIWIRREMVGTAGFRLEIAANGRVESCTITRSTGHADLDNATCALVTKRAKFEPARGPQGEAVKGSYTSAVKWQLPD